jgi:hypothetical protein
MSISSQCVYPQTPKSLPVEKYELSIQPTSGNTFSPGDQVEFLIPTRPYEFLNAVNTTIQFNIRNNHTGGVFVDHNFSNMIERVEVYHGSNLLEQLSGYGVLFTTMAEAQMSKSSIENGLQIGWGLNNDPSTDPDNQVNLPRCGSQLASNAIGYALMPLLSSVVGLASNPSKFLPVCKMTAGPLRVVLTMRYGIGNLAGTHPTPDPTQTAAPISFSNMLLNCEFVKVGDQAMGVIDKANEAVYGSKDIVQITTRQYDQFLYTLPTGTTAGSNITSLVDARYSSVNGLIFSFLQNTPWYKNSNRVNPYSSLQVRIGSNFYPRRPIKSSTGDAAESFIQSQKYLGALNDVHTWGSIILRQYVRNANAFAPTTGTFPLNDGGYYLMLNTEAYQKDGALFDGISTLNDSIFVDGVLLTVLNSNILAYVHVCHDTVLSVQGGVMTRSM